MAGKKQLEEMLASNLALLKTMAQASGNKDVLKKVEEQEKKLVESGGVRENLTCEGCKTVKSLTVRGMEQERSKGFTCPHNSFFCAKCVKKERMSFLEKRKQEKKDRMEKKEKKDKEKKGK